MTRPSSPGGAAVTLIITIDTAFGATYRDSHAVIAPIASHICTQVWPVGRSAYGNRSTNGRAMLRRRERERERERERVRETETGRDREREKEKKRDRDTERERQTEWTYTPHFAKLHIRNHVRNACGCI